MARNTEQPIRCSFCGKRENQAQRHQDHACVHHQRKGISLYAFGFFQMTNGSGKAVDHRFLIFVDMAVGVGNAVGVHIGMIVFV